MNILFLTPYEYLIKEATNEIEFIFKIPVHLNF